jgi:CBS domain-containing protein
MKATVADIMTRNPVTVNSSMNLLDCAKKMIKQKIRSLIIVDGKNLVGFLSQKDIIWAMIKKSRKELSEINAIDVSPRKIVSVRPSFLVSDAIKKMKKTKFDKFPVVEKGELMGMLTAKDILTFHPEFYPEFEEFAMIREESKKLKRIKELKKGDYVSDGVCEECGNRELLHKFNGMLLCGSCKDSS